MRKQRNPSYAEEALRASELRYRRLFETAKDGILILDAKTGQITDVNSFLANLPGYSYDELSNQSRSERLWLKGVYVPGLRNLEKRLLRVESRLARRVEPQVPMEQIGAIFDLMNEADRKLVSELKGLTREQIAAKINDDTQFRAFARRAIALAGPDAPQ